MGLLTTISLTKTSQTRCKWKVIHHKPSATHICHKRNDNPNTAYKKFYPHIWLSVCSPHHPLPQNKTNPFPKPPGASSPHPPPWAHPRWWGTARVWMNLHPQIGGGAWLGVKEEESKDKRITKGCDGSEGLDSTEYVRVRWVSKSVSSSMEYNRRVERWTHFIQSNVIIGLMWVEERAPYRCTKLIAMKHLDPHRCSSSYHGCI